MSCIQAVSCLPASNVRNTHLTTSRSLHSIICMVTPIHAYQLPKAPLRLTFGGSAQKRSGPVCLFSDKRKSNNPSEASSWKALENAMGSLKKEQSIEDVLRQQIEKQEYLDDGSRGGNRPGDGGDGGSGGSSSGGGGRSGESEDEGIAGIIDEVVQVTLATLGFVFLYVYIIDGEDITRLAQDIIKYIFGGKKSFRLQRAMYEWGRFYQHLNRKNEVQEDWLESAIINTPTWYDSPEKYKYLLRSYMQSRSRD